MGWDVGVYVSGAEGVNASYSLFLFFFLTAGENRRSGSLHFHRHFFSSEYLSSFPLISIPSSTTRRADDDLFIVWGILFFLAGVSGERRWGWRGPVGRDISFRLHGWWPRIVFAGWLEGWMVGRAGLGTPLPEPIPTRDEAKVGRGVSGSVFVLFLLSWSVRFARRASPPSLRLALACFLACLLPRPSGKPGGRPASHWVREESERACNATLKLCRAGKPGRAKRLAREELSW